MQNYIMNHLSNQPVFCILLIIFAPYRQLSTAR